MKWTEVFIITNALDAVFKERQCKKLSELDIGNHFHNCFTAYPETIIKIHNLEMIPSKKS